jgi:hypothetical protein
MVGFFFPCKKKTMIIFFSQKNKQKKASMECDQDDIWLGFWIFFFLIFFFLLFFMPFRYYRNSYYVEITPNRYKNRPSVLVATE